MTGWRPSLSGRKTSQRSTTPSSMRIGTSQSTRIPSRISLLGDAMWSVISASLACYSCRANLTPRSGAVPRKAAPEAPNLKIGVAGTGRMGAAIAQRLLGVGHELTVWNRTADKTRPLAAAGAKVAATPALLAAASEAIITILTDARAIADAYHGKDGLLSG